MKIISIKHCIVAAVGFFLFCSPVTAAVKITPLPPPQSSAKLRIFSVAVTTESQFKTRPVLWPVSPEEFDRIQKRAINERLKLQGIYEVVSDMDLHAVIGDQTVSRWEWTAHDWALARDVGKALHADYVMVFERSFRINVQFDTKLINLNTGKQFEASGYVPSAMSRHMMHDDQKKRAGSEVMKIQFRQIFHDAKNDLLQTAIRKGKVAGKEPELSSPAAPTPQSQKEVAVLPTEEKPPQALPVQTGHTQKTPVQANVPQNNVTDGKISEKQLVFEKELEQAFSAKDNKRENPRLVVYDFDASEQLKVVGLILTEALREELYHLGGFVLVNRENILKIMDEYKLQQTSLIAEKQAVQVGKWLAANEAVTGNLAILGNTSILQVKRIDITTLGTMALGSLKCPAGQEDELLNKMPELARKLTNTAK